MVNGEWRVRVSDDGNGIFRFLTIILYLLIMIYIFPIPIPIPNQYLFSGRDDTQIIGPGSPLFDLPPPHRTAPFHSTYWQRFR